LVEKQEARVYAAAGNALLDDTGVDGAQFIEAACHRSVEASVQPGPSLLDIQAGRLVLVDQSAERSLIFDPLAKPLPQQLLVRGQPFLDDRNGLGQLVLLPPSTALSIMLATSPPGQVPLLQESQDCFIIWVVHQTSMIKNRLPRPIHKL
jgi:hypothetical protein